MNYTIATLTECCKDHPLTLDISSRGNKYLVYLSGGESGEYTSATFDSLTEAYKVFEKLSSWIIFGYYAEKDKRTYLATGLMV